MSRVVIAAFAMLAASAGFPQNNCLDCHLELEDDALTPPATAFSDDVHEKAGLTCASCHGGDPTANVDDGEFERAMDPEKGYIGVPKRSEIPAMCGRCHSDPGYMHAYDPNIAVDQLVLAGRQPGEAHEGRDLSCLQRDAILALWLDLLRLQRGLESRVRGGQRLCGHHQVAAEQRHHAERREVVLRQQIVEPRLAGLVCRRARRLRQPNPIG